MAKVKDIFLRPPSIELNTEWADKITLADIWARYDEETDSMTIYVTGEPVPGVNVYLKDDVYAIVDTRDRNKMIGLYFESWEDQVSEIELARRSWDEIRKDGAWSLALRMLALAIVTASAKNTLTPQFA